MYLIGGDFLFLIYLHEVAEEFVGDGLVLRRNELEVMVEVLIGVCVEVVLDLPAQCDAV